MKQFKLNKVKTLSKDQQYNMKGGASTCGDSPSFWESLVHWWQEYTANK